MKPILIIAPDEKIHGTALLAARGRPDVALAQGLLEQAVPIALAAQARGARVIISRGGTTRLLERSGLTVPVVDIPVSSMGMLKAIHRAGKISPSVTVLGSRRIIRDVRALGELLEIDLEVHGISDTHGAREYVEDRIRSGRPPGVLLGGVAAEALAKEHGLPTVLLRTTREEIEKALEQAFKLLEVRRLELSRSERFKAILENINHGVIAVDRQGDVTIFNKAAARITGVSRENAAGRPLSKVVPTAFPGEEISPEQPELGKLIRFGRTLALSNQVPVKVGDETVGMVETLEDVTKIREYENIIRQKMSEKGHLARFSFDDILGSSPVIQKTRALAEKYARVDSTVLIQGDSGTGKEVFAQGIHSASSRSKGPFVAVNCGAIPETLLESELFGYREGAFSGARQGGRDGLFALAHTGTIFLDEISETSANFQSTLLRVIQEMEVRPLGSDKVIAIDVRIIAATNKPLKHLVDRGRFRSDLYYRLNILRLEIPSLAMRKADISEFVLYFVNHHASKLARPITVSQTAMAMFRQYPWPGNIRELRNIMERLCVTCGNAIDKALVTEMMDELDPEDSLEAEGMDCLKKQHIKAVLAQCGNNRTQAARKLGISRTTLWRELSKK